MKRLIAWAVLLAACLGLYAPVSAFADIPAEYADCLYPIRVDGKWGYMNYSGEVVIPPQWDYAGPFDFGVAPVMDCKEEGALLQINTPEELDESRNSGTCGDATWGLIGKDGAFLLPMAYADIWTWSDSGRMVGVIKKDDVQKEFLYNAETGKLTESCWYTTTLYCGKETPYTTDSNYIDENGNVAIDCPDSEVLGVFNEGTALIDHLADDFSRYRSIIGRDGKEIINDRGREWSLFECFYNELALVVNDGGYGYIDESGALVIDTVWPYAERFSGGGMAVVSDDFWDGFFGCIDKAGTLIIPFVYDHIWDFQSNGRALAVRRVKWGTDCWYQDPDAFLWLLLDRDGREYPLPGTCEPNAQFSEGLFLVKAEGLWGYADENGAQVIPAQWDTAEPFANGLAMVVKDGKITYIGRGGNVVWQEK